MLLMPNLGNVGKCYKCPAALEPPARLERRKKKHRPYLERVRGRSVVEN